MLRAGVFLQDRYEILEQIGSGGMSEVYKARCHKLNRLVAIKVLKEEFCNDSSFVAKFNMEAQAAAGLAHPNIVNVYDVVDEGSIHYIVMELVEGITLKTYIAKKERLEIKESIGIAIQVAQGIAAAHEQHIIHRDIKPQNMLISKDGKVKVADFGIARAVSAQTLNSAAMGSVHYISPEQARGGFSDERSDIYSLGITIYEMVTGKLPFNGESTVAIALSHLEDVMVPPSVYNPEIPKVLEQIILKCCEKKPERRYADVNELIADLRHVLVMPDTETVRKTADETEMVGKQPDTPEDGTRKISDSELAMIRRSSKTTEKELPDEKSLPDKQAQDRIKTRKKSSKESDHKKREPKFEHLFTAAGVVAAALIVVVLIAVFTKLGGVFQAGTGLLRSGYAATQTEESDGEGLSENELYTPDVRGMTQEAASQLLRENDLNPRFTYEYSDDVAKELVIRQEPEAGSVIVKWSDVTVTVSNGTDKVDITALDIENMDAASAVRILRAMNLEVVTETVENDSVEAGDVIGYTPELAEEGSVVTLYVSSGGYEEEENSEIVQTPSITGLTEEEAIALLAEAGLSPGATVLEYSDEVSRGTIISQSAEAGTDIAVGGTVDYVISAGPEEAVMETVSTQRYVASISDVYELKNLIGPGAGTASMTISIRLHQVTNGTDVYKELTAPVTVTGDTMIPINFTSIESINGSSDGEVEVVNASTGEVLESYSLTFFPMD
ncbi:MAG: Stk1 family PASTA domain-containing Ser/Thr kinase [Clostridiales bacterium]|nr:Stk1 family PASTA domain-containing Ser/Thr kinase [Clostridiales bacterium]